MLQFLIKHYQNINFFTPTLYFNFGRAIIFIILLGVVSNSVLAQEEISENPFANFETIMLPNGLKIWYKYLPNDSNVSLSITVPSGFDQDPIGKEQLAHFTEHMLFSDHLGRTEEQIKKEIEDLGGVRNAYTFADRTFYFVRIDKKHGFFALDWLYKVISPHSMVESVVEKQREPVAIEVGARKRELFDWIDAYYLNPSFLSQPNFWSREFGEQAFPDREYYPYGSLYKITSEDLKHFYDSYYTPEGMTLTIIGNLNRDEVLDKINSTFAELQSRPRHKQVVTLKNPSRFWQAYTWDFQPSLYYLNAFKFYNLTQTEQLKLIFISQFLQNRLNSQLRYGDRKATYSIGAIVSQRGLATLLQIFGNLKESEYDFARGIIDKELEALSNGTLKNEDFETEKAAITRKLKVTNSSAKDLEQWVVNSFYNYERHQNFPDVVTIFDQFNKTDIEEFARLNLVKQNQVFQIGYTHFLSQGTLSVIALVLLLFTIEITRRYLLQPLPISQIRYIARFRMPLLTNLLVGFTLVTLVAIGGRILFFFYELLAYKFISHIESFWVQWSIYALMAIISLFLFMLLLASLPRKLFLFKNSMAIKYLSYRSVIIPLTDIKEISLHKFSSVWLSRRIWKCIPLTFALFSSGIYLRLSNGWAYFFQIRDKEEFLKVLAEIQQAKCNLLEKSEEQIDN